VDGFCLGFNKFPDTLVFKRIPLPSAWHIVHPRGKKMSTLAMAFRQHLRTESRQHDGSQPGAVEGK